VIHLTIVTPIRKLVDRQVDEVVLPGSEGSFGVLPGHAPLLSALQVGEIMYRQGSEARFVAVAWGFTEVLSDKVSVLADIAESAEDIDVERAREASERARQRLQSGGDDVDWERARVALDKALVRMSVASKKG